MSGRFERTIRSSGDEVSSPDNTSAQTSVADSSSSTEQWKETDSLRRPKISFFSEWKNFSNWNKFKGLKERTKIRIREKYNNLSSNSLRRKFLNALFGYIDSNNSISEKDVWRISDEVLKRDIEDAAVQKNCSIKDGVCQFWVTLVSLASSASKWAVGFATWAAKYATSFTQKYYNSDNNENYNKTPSSTPDQHHEDSQWSSPISNENSDSNTKSERTDTSRKSVVEQAKSEIPEHAKEEALKQIDEIFKDDVVNAWFKKNLNKIIREPEINNWLIDSVDCNWWMWPKLYFIKETNPKFYNLNSLNQEFEKWNNERLKNITKLFNVNTLWIFADKEQGKKVPEIFNKNNLGQSAEFEDTAKGKQTENNTLQLDEYKKTVELFHKYTKSEMIWEMIIKYDMKNSDNLFMLQLLLSAYLDKEHIWDLDTLTWKWDKDTQKFLEDLLNDEEFIKDPNSKRYAEAINKTIDDLGRFDTSNMKSKYESFSASIRRDQEYRKDPEAFWRKQAIEWPREFVWITNSVHLTSYKEWEKDFLYNNMKWFNKKIEDFLTLPKLQEWETPNAETKAKMDQIWNAIPIEQLNSIYEKFASNPEEQKKFEEFLKNNNLPSIDLQDNSLKNFVVRKNLSLNPAAEYCYQRLWTCLQEQITWEAGKTLQYLSDKTWDTAFNIKNKVLEFFLPGISIHPENSENWIFYFRDENNLDTLYWFDPEDWKIFQKGNISLWEDGIIKFWASEAEWNLLKQIHGFQDMINFELWDILPDKNADNVDELEKQIAKKIESKINVESVVDTSVVSQALLKKENEKNVCRDRIVWDIKYLLDIDRSELHSWDWEKYKIFRSLVKTFEKIKVENPNDNTPLVTMKDFLDKVYSSASQWSLLKPSNNWENTEERGDDNLPQEGENWSIENQPQEIWKTILLKNLIDPQTQLFDISLITTLNQDKEIDDFLAKRDFNNVIWKISKRKDLQELDKDTNNQISQLTEKTSEELRWLYEETQLLASIDALETQGDFLS